MKSPSIKIIRILLVTPLLFGGIMHAQFNREIIVYPFSKTNRNDSIVVAVKRVELLLNAQKVFEKTYLNKILVFMPLPDKYNFLIKKDKAYLDKRDYLPLLAKYPDLKSKFKKFNSDLIRIVDSSNVDTRARNEIMKKLMKDSPQVQDGLLEIHEMQDYEIIMSPVKNFEAIRPDPRRSYLYEAIQNDIEQRLLGKPHNLDGYINSINYVPFNLKRLRMPELVEALIQQNLQLWKKIVDNSNFKNKIEFAKTNTIKIYDDSKLWLNTDIKNKTINLSPYLIRAVFTTSFYQDSILRLAENIENEDGDLKIYFHGKSGASVRKIDAAYFENFVNRFSENLFFVLGHELAHIYLSGTKQKDIETACDTYAAYFYLKHFKKLDIGVFRTMLISSIKSDELNYWGKDIDRAALTKRFANLETIRKTKNINRASVSIELPK